jgi:mannose-6-phosphate isomerase-like protein (cupin superfamily)
MNRLHIFASIAALALLGTSPPPPHPPAVDALFPGGRFSETFDELLAEHPLEPGKDFQVSELGRDASSSHHLVWIVDREQPHRHDRHDLFVVILRGSGTMRIGAESKPVGPGSILYVPRGTPHAFTNEYGSPAAAYAVYVPPYDGKDREPLD